MGVEGEQNAGNGAVVSEGEGKHATEAEAEAMRRVAARFV